MTDPETDEVTVEFDEAVLAALDERARKRHRENRAAAIRDLLEEWLRHRDDRP